MDKKCIYFDITKKEQDSAIRYLLGAILKTRSNEGIPSNKKTFDEDVNVYLAHLLFAVSLPQYHEMAEPYLSNDTNEVMRWVRDSKDRTIRYFIYKVNADHMLIHSAIFNDLSPKSKVMFRRSKRHFRELAKLYYDQAASYHKRIYRKRTAVGDVLNKLAQHYDMYQRLLTVVKRDYFQFIESFRDQAFKGFTHELNSYEREFKLKKTMDEFLERYAKWLETKNPELEAEIIQLSRILSQLDPQFHFDVSKFKSKRGDEGEKKAA